MGIGQMQPAVDGRNPVVEAVPVRTEKVRKQTEAVHKRCKYGVHLQQAESVLCPCIRAIFPVHPVLGVKYLAITLYRIFVLLSSHRFFVYIELGILRDLGVKSCWSHPQPE